MWQLHVLSYTTSSSPTQILFLLQILQTKVMFTISLGHHHPPEVPTFMEYKVMRLRKQKVTIPHNPPPKMLSLPSDMYSWFLIKLSPFSISKLQFKVSLKLKRKWVRKICCRFQSSRALNTSRLNWSSGLGGKKSKNFLKSSYPQTTHHKQTGKNLYDFY